MTVPTWIFEEIGGWGGVTGEGWKNVLASTEDLTEEGRLVREAIQNLNDAHDKSSEDSSVRARITRRILSAKDLEKMAELLRLHDELGKRLEYLKLDSNNAFLRMIKGKGDVEITIIEDFNTIGLGGALPGTHGQTLEGDHFQKLLYLLGGTDKTSSAALSGGSYGYGKSVYSAASDCSTAFYYSSFKADARSNNDSARFIGCSLFDAHAFGNKNNTGRAYFGIRNSENIPVPAVNEQAHELAKAFGLRPRLKNERGTTVAIIGTHINMDRIRTEIEKWWWPKLVNQELVIELFDGDRLITPPSPKENATLKPFLTCFEILMNRQNADAAKGQKRGKLGPLEGKALGDWAAIRVDADLAKDEELDDTLLNKVALLRGAKMVVQYNPRLTLPEAQVPLAGVFIASDDEHIEMALKLSEPPAHNLWSHTSSRLSDEQQKFVKALWERLRRQIRNFHKELLPPPPKSKGRLKLMEELLGRLLEGNPGISNPEPTIDLFTVTHDLKRKSKDGRVRIVGTVQIAIREDADSDEMSIDYLPRIEILENENLAVGEDLNLTQLKITQGKAKIITRDKRQVVTGVIGKKRPISLFVESAPTNPDWVLAYREEINSIVS